MVRMDMDMYMDIASMLELFYYRILLEITEYILPNISQGQVGTVGRPYPSSKVHLARARLISKMLTWNIDIR